MNKKLAKLADIPLFTGNPEEVCPLGLTPTTSTTVMTVVGDIIVVLMMEKLNLTKRYAKRHHSGYLGQKQKNEKIYIDSSPCAMEEFDTAFKCKSSKSHLQ